MKKLFLLTLLISSELLAQNILHLLPDSAGKWHKNDSAKVYSGTTLYKLIDGGAAIFEEYGFKQVLVQRYIDNSANTIDVEVYEMLDSVAAYGIFSLFTLNTGKKINFLNDAFAGEEFLLLRKGKCYISLTAINSLDSSKEGIIIIAKKIDSMIEKTNRPVLVSMFEGFKKSGAVYIKGILGLNNLLAVNPGDNFIVTEGIYLKTDNSGNLILKYETEDDSYKNYISLLKNLRGNANYKLLNSEPNAQLFAENNSFINCLKYRNFIVIHLTKDRSTIDKTTEKIKTIIKANAFSVQ